MTPAAQKRAAFVVGLLVLGAAAVFFFGNDVWRAVSPTLHKEKINKYAAIYKMDPLFLMAVVRVESSFDGAARSHRGAIGLMQIMPDTAREMAGKIGVPHDAANLQDPDINLHLGVEYLSQLRADFPGDLTAQLAAYNAGPANVRSWRKGATLQMSEIEFPETRRFVQRVQDTHTSLKRIQKVKNALHA